MPGFRGLGPSDIKARDLHILRSWGFGSVHSLTGPPRPEAAIWPERQESVQTVLWPAAIAETIRPALLSNLESMPSLVFRRALLTSLVAHAGVAGLVAGAWQEDRSERGAEVLTQDHWHGNTVEISAEVAKLPLVVPSLPPVRPVVEESAEEPSRSPPRTKSNKPMVAAPPRSLPVPAASEPVETSADAEPAGSGSPKLDSASSPGIDVADGGATLEQPASADLGAAMRASAAGSAERGLFGGVGVDPKERNLFRAMVRAIPVAVRGEARWWDKPPGYRVEVRFSVTLDDSGRVADVAWLEPRTSRPSFELVRRLGALLRAGRFALPSEREKQHQQAFRLVLEMEQGRTPGSPSGEPGDVVEMGFEAPHAAERGTAFLRDASGRRLAGTLWRLGTQPAPPLTEEGESTPFPLPAPSPSATAQP